MGGELWHRIHEGTYAGAGETLGQKIWPSANRLCELLSQRPELVRGKAVIELGCGVGLAGLMAAKVRTASVGWYRTGKELNQLITVSIEDRCKATVKQRRRTVRRTGTADRRGLPTGCWHAGGD